MDKTDTRPRASQIMPAHYHVKAAQERRARRWVAKQLAWWLFLTGLAVVGVVELYRLAEVWR